MIETRGQVRRYASKLMLSGASQAVSSVTNFGISLYLLRALDKVQFGFFGFGIAIAFATAAVLGALYSVQMVIGLPDQTQHHRPIYAMHHVVALVMGGVAITIVVLTVGLMGGWMGVIPWSAVIHIFPILLASLTFALRDILTRLAYVEHRERVALAANLLIATGVAGFLSVSAAVSEALYAKDGLYGYAFGQLLGSAYLLLSLRLSWTTIRIGAVAATTMSAWRGGRWHMLTSLTYSIRTQAHNFVVAPILGFAALAELNAARFFVAPAAMLLPSIYHLALPRMAERRVQGSAQVARATVFVTSILLLVIVVFAIGVLATLDSLHAYLLQEEYGDLRHLVIAWSFIVLFQAARNGIAMGHEALRAFRSLFAVNFIASCVAIALSVPFAMIAGGSGVLWAIASAEILLVALLSMNMYNVVVLRDASE